MHVSTQLINIMSRPLFPNLEDVGKMPIINLICGNQVTANSKRNNSKC